MTDRTHRLKTWGSAFRAVASGDKTFEYRRNDRDFAVGDEVLLEEWDPAFRNRTDPLAGHTPGGGYTGRVIRARITYVLQGQFGVPADYAVLALRNVETLK